MYKLRNIKPKKSSEWHAKMHPYFTKQPANVIAEYIKAFSKEGDTVLDPFSGTGTTGIASLELKRKVRLFDLSPFSCFISKETVRTDFDLNKFKAEHSKIVQEIEGFEETIWELSDGELEKYKIKDWYPKKVKMPKNADFEYVHELFDKKQLVVFARLLAMINQIEDEKVKQQMRLVFSNTLGKCNLTYMPSEKDGKQVGGGGQVFLENIGIGSRRSLVC